MKTCHVCQMQIADEALKCDTCGEKFAAPEWSTPVLEEGEGPRPKGPSPWGRLLKALLFLGLCGAAYYFYWVLPQAPPPAPTLTQEDPAQVLAGRCLGACQERCRKLWGGSQTCEASSQGVQECLGPCVKSGNWQELPQ